MDAFYSQLLLVMSIQILCLVSPGPDFFIVVRHAMQYSRKTGLYTAAGISAGLSVHIIYSILGLGYLISSSVALFTLIRYIGAAYLIYIGIKAIRSTGMKPADAADLKPSDQVQKTPGALKAFRSGFLTNVLNPKCTLFILSLFSTVITPDTPVLVQTLYGVLMVSSTLIWFALVSYLFSFSKTRQLFQRFSKTADRCFGGILIFFGTKLALWSQS